MTDSTYLIVYAYVIIITVVFLILCYIIGNSIGEIIVNYLIKKKRNEFFVIVTSYLPDKLLLKDILDVYSVKMNQFGSEDKLKNFQLDLQILKVKILEKNSEIIPKDASPESLKEWSEKIDNFSYEFEKEYPFLDLSGDPPVLFFICRS